jgi:hypothetical protein
VLVAHEDRPSRLDRPKPGAAAFGALRIDMPNFLNLFVRFAATDDASFSGASARLP